MYLTKGDYKELYYSIKDNYSLDNDRYYNLELPSQFEGCLCLKIGARVICTRNDKKAGYINFFKLYFPSMQTFMVL